MVRLDLVRDKISRLRDTTAWLRACLPEQTAAMTASRDVRDLVSFRVYLVMQEAIDLCSHVIADQGWGPVPSLRDHFSLLAEKAVLSSDLAGRLSAGVKLRNLVGHGYAEVDPTKMQAAARELAGLVDPFCNAILAFAESHPS
jgi:uncharacterized protein YutE (UPF0331/DUF86 family)